MTSHAESCPYCWGRVRRRKIDGRRECLNCRRMDLGKPDTYAKDNGWKPPPDLITRKEAAAMVGVTPNTLYRWNGVAANTFPRPIKMGHPKSNAAVRYRRSHIMKWINDYD